MAEQNFSNHARYDPAFHYVAMPVLLVNVLVTAYRFIRHANLTSAWAVVIALVLLLVTFKVRNYALRVQSRVIRMEERIRMAALLPLELHPLQRELTTGQLIALRFASDAELATLTQQAAEQSLPPKAIKQRIQQWRADHHRV